MKTYRLNIGSGETAVTAATWDTSCAPVPQDFTHTDDSGFQEIVTDGHWAFDNNIIRFTASTNPTNAVREGYMTITYTVDGVSYKGKRFVDLYYRCPQKGEQIDVFYDPKKPENYACYAFGPAVRPIGW